MNICVFASSSQRLEQKHYDFARELGKEIARASCGLVFGGGRLGLMGACADGVLSGGGEITGVVPELLNKPGIPHPACKELIVTPTMHTRKEKMEELCGAFITLPGGFGTLEELLEVMTLKQLGYHKKAIVLCNGDGFFDALLEQFEQCFAGGFAHIKSRGLYHVAFTAKEAVHIALNAPEWEAPDKMADSRSVAN